MIDAISTGSGVVGKVATPITGQKKEAGVKESAPKVAASAGAPAVNPRLRYDATSGVIVTEFLDRAGAVQASSPNTAVLAYLRAGLTEDGRGEASKLKAKS